MNQAITEELPASAECERPMLRSFVSEYPDRGSRHAGLIPVKVRELLDDGECAQAAELRVDDGQWTDMGPAFTLPSGERLWQATVNGLLLDSGPHTLSLRTVGAPGVTAPPVVLPIDIANTGKLFHQVRDNMNASGKGQLVIPGLLTSRSFPYREYPSRAWFDQPDASSQIERRVRRASQPREYAQYLEKFIRDGFFAIPNLVPADWCEAINADVDRRIADGSIPYRPGSGDRIQLLFRQNEDARALWLHQTILELLYLIFDDEPTPCHTLNFVHGSQQTVHQDSLYLSTYPEGYMCGVWVALEDIHPDSGPLVVYPGSHRFNAVFAGDAGVEQRNPWTDSHLSEELREKWQPVMYDLVERSSAGYHCTIPRGTALFWHGNLLHAGACRQNPALTRRSMVSHYYARGACVFSDGPACGTVRTLLEDAADFRVQR